MKLLPSIMLAFVLGAMFVSLFHMSMEEGGMSDCLFMHHSESVCEMTFADHMTAWQSIFLAVTPTVTFLLFVVAIACIPYFIRLALRFLRAENRYIHVYVEIRELSYTYLRELFSNGILHPKLFV